MSPHVDRSIVNPIIELEAAVRAAEARRVAANGGPGPITYCPADDHSIASQLTPEEQRLHDHLAALDRDTLAQVLALYWFGRQASWESVGEEGFHSLLARARDNLEDAVCYLTAKVNLGESLRHALAILGVPAARPDVAVGTAG
jgi:hypothetical protein